MADEPLAETEAELPPDSASERVLLRAQRWALAHWPRNRRRQAAIVLALMAAVVGTAVASAHLLRWIHEWLDLLAYAGLFVTCWIGAGGLLVPIPGVRWVGLLMIVQQGATLAPGVTALVAATAMVLGQTSWFLAARTAAQARRRSAAAPAPAATPAPAVASVPAEPLVRAGATGPGAAGGVPAPAAPAAASAVAAAPAPGGKPPATGRRARLAARSARARATTERRLREHAIATLYMAGLIPSPLTSIASSTSGAIGIPLGRFVIAIFAGFLTLAGILAFFGDTLADLITRFHLIA